MNQQKPDTFQLGIKALIRNRKGEILVLKSNPNYKYITSKKSAYWDLPGGRLHKDNSIEETLRREVMEEVRIKDIKIEKLLDASISKHRPEKNLGLILFTFLCSIADTNVIKFMDDEHIDFKWCSPKKAASLLNNKFSDTLCEAVRNL